MEVVLAFNGSRGDVQPAVALGTELASRGHRARFAVPPNLVEFVRSAGFLATPVGYDTAQALASHPATSSANPLRRLRAVTELTTRSAISAQRDLLTCAANADVIVGGSVGQERAINVATALGIPYLPIHYCPMRANHTVSLVPQPLRGIGRTLNRASWTVIEQALWRASRQSEVALAADLDLPTPTVPTAARIAAQRSPSIPEVQAYDPLLFPGLAKEWGEGRPLTGFLALDATTRARLAPSGTNKAVLEWISQGPAPIYVGFGSMPLTNPEALAQAISSSAHRDGYRFLVAAGWSGFMENVADISDRIMVVPALDHERILPHCAAAITHGGAGTCGAIVRAGIPALICPVGAEQPMWGRQLARAGVAMTTSLSRLDADTLGKSLAALTDRQMQQRSATLSEQLIRPADAVARATEVIESHVVARPAAAVSC